MKSATDLVKNGKHFCILPWIHFHGWPNGKVMPCCVADSSKPVSEITEDRSILDVMNSDEYKRMRLAMLNDEYYEPCQRCYTLEEMGTWTMRQSHNVVRGMDCLDIIEDTNTDGSIDEFQLKYMDIRFSNLCNYKCRSCGPACSNLWGEEKIKEYESKEEFLEVFQLPDIKVSNNSTGTFMEKLKKHLHQVEECYFAGGEILVTPEHYETLDFWVEHNMQEKVILNYTTNMSKLTYKDKNGVRNLFDYWKQFPNVEIWASLDDMGDRAELIRKGTNWDKVVENLKRIKAEVPHVKLGFTPTISIWNVWNYHKLFDMLYEEGLLDPANPPRLNILTSPSWAAITVLPGFAIKRLKEIYEKYEEKYDSYGGKTESMIRMRNTFKILNTTLDSALYKKGDPDLFQQFIYENEKMDKARGESILEIIPELKEIYEWSNKNKTS